MKLSIQLVILLCVSAWGACKRHSGPETMPRPKIAVYRTTQDSLPRKMVFIGQISANSQVTIQPRISGFLLSKNYDNGMPVRKGQLLFRIDPTQFLNDVSSAEAMLASAQASLVEAQNNYDRAVPLARINAISQSSLDEYKAQAASAKASLKSAESSLRNAKLQLSYTYLYAPIDGVIGASSASIGDYVGVGTKFNILNTISDIDTVAVQASMPVAQYLEIRGDSLNAQPTYENKALFSNLTLSLSDGSVFPEKGYYDYTQRDVDNATGTINFIIKFANPSHILKPGQYARITADVGAIRPAILVPQECVSQSQGVNSVWVMRPDSSVEFRKVTLGQTVGQLWAIESGLEAGEAVLTSGQMKMRSGMKIIPVYTSSTPQSNAGNPISSEKR